MEVEESPRGRSAFRLRLPCTVVYRADGQTACGTLRDISAAGISVEKVSHELPNQAQAVLELHFSDSLAPIEVEVEVVRQTSSGFAGRFVNLGGKRAVMLWDQLTAALTSQIGEV